MKLFLYVILAFTTMALTTACSPPRHMLVKDQPWQDIRSVVPEKGKSAIVVVRPSILAVHMPINTYLDKNMIGSLKGKTYFVKTDITPGNHYIISKWADAQFGPLRILFEENRVYYIRQLPAFGGYVVVTPSMPDDLIAEWDDGIKQLECDLKDRGADLTDYAYEEAEKDYEREEKEGRHKEIQGYKGVLVKNK
jgi:hypothetical protein